LITSGIYLGGAFASLSIILDSSIGWRNTILVIGGIGALAFAAIATFVSEPRSTEISIDAKASGAMLSNNPTSSSVSKVFSSLTDVSKSPEARLIFAVRLYLHHENPQYEDLKRLFFDYLFLCFNRLQLCDMRLDFP
jgi:hypothetical protein